MTSTSSRTPSDVWHGVAFELARQPAKVTANMRKQHPRGRDGRCCGPHGRLIEQWPCSTRRLADAADRLRKHTVDRTRITSKVSTDPEPD